MATNTGAFVAEIGTTFVVLAVGFGGGLMLAKSAPNERPQLHARAASEEPKVPIRVILPTSAGARAASAGLKNAGADPAACSPAPRPIGPAVGEPAIIDRNSRRKEICGREEVRSERARS